MAYHGGYRLPERITATLSALRGGGDAVSQMLSAAAVFLDAIANHNHTARRDAEHALDRVDTEVAAVTGPEAAIAQRFSQQLHEAATVRFGELRRPDLIGSLRAACDGGAWPPDLDVAGASARGTALGGRRSGDRRRDGSATCRTAIGSC